MTPDRYLLQHRHHGALVACGEHNAYDWLRDIIKHHNNQNPPDRQIPHMAPHDFRRPWCTDLLERGTPIQSVSLLMEHEQLTTTSVYDHTSPNQAAAHFKAAQRAVAATASGHAC